MSLSLYQQIVKSPFNLGDLHIHPGHILDNKLIYYTLNSLSLFWLAESVQRIFEISTCDIITADYTIIMSRKLKVKANHVVYDSGAWFLKVIMSNSLALSCLPSVKKQKHDLFCFVQCIIKPLLDSVFVISRIIKVLVRVTSLRLRLQLITPTSTLIILDIAKTSSNKKLKYQFKVIKLNN